MWQQLKGLSIEAHIEQHLRVMHVVGKLSWRREVAEGHHLFGAIDDNRLIDVGTSGLGLLLEEDNIMAQFPSHVPNFQNSSLKDFIVSVKQLKQINILN